MLRVLYFASVREAIGRDEEALAPPSDVTTVAALIEWLAAASPRHTAAFADRARLRAAVDQEFVPLDASITGAHEIAIFPPVTGG